MARITQIINKKIDLNGDIKSWVDYGSGDGKVIKGLKWNQHNIKKISIEKKPIIFDDGWEFSENLNNTLKQYGKMDLFTSFDCIEHLNKKDGVELINHVCENFKHVIFFTPKGFLQQDEKTHPQLIKNNPWQKHLSGWNKKEFEDLGFKVIILKNFHNPDGVAGLWDALIAYK